MKKMQLDEARNNAVVGVYLPYAKISLSEK